MNIDRIKMLRLLASIDQDRQAGADWIRQHSTAELATLAEFVMQEHDDPLVELMSAFATVGLKLALADAERPPGAELE